MDCLALSLGFGFLFRVIETLIFAYVASVSLAVSGGLFPRLENVGAFKGVSIVPAQAVCGLPGPSVFCDSSTAAESIQFCTQRLCVQDCPYRSSSAPYTALFSAGHSSCTAVDKSDLRPHSPSNSTSFIFGKHKNCFPSPSPRLAEAFTLAVWLKLEQEGEMCVIEKTVDGQSVFKLTVSEKETMFYYRTVNGLQPPIKVMTLGRILVKKWIHLSVQVHRTKINFFLNGVEEGNMAFDTRTLSGSIAHFASGTIQIGQSLNGLEQFVGRMQDFRLYQVALTNREVLEVFSGGLPRLHVQSHCRCPGSHPRVHPLLQQYCVPNGSGDTVRDRVLRLGPNAHPLSFVNDNDVGTSWVSHVFANNAQLDGGVTISVDLENGQYQVFYIVIQFFSPQPTAIKIQRKKEDSLDWEDWQYFARNCSAFGMENNGDLENPDSVNCLQLDKFTPYSRGNVTFSILTPEPKHRPGYNDFYNTPSLQEFIKATQIRLHFRGQYHTADAAVNPRHRYYAVAEITIAGRCQCHGHASRCDTATRPYRCLCSPDSFTEGLHCDRCLPLYNDKPFRGGDQAHTFTCKPCQCHNHSTSCHYDASVDPFPLELGRGGGGVCDACQHHTAGRNCELCKDYFFREVGAEPSAADVCKPCDCEPAGTKSGSLSCDQTGGQCNCKRHVSGRQCNQCQAGFYSLRESDADGCSPCGCSTSGTVDGDITCHPDSGQCKCKANVTGLKCDQCSFGFKFLRSFNDDGCGPCQCNLHGSVNKACDPFSGQCDCKDEARGLQCDTCRENFYGLDATGCKACECDAAGSVPGTVCDAETGQCVCKPSIGGRQCEDCLEGSFYLAQNDSFLCLPCDCDTSGTVNGSLVCDKATGQCPCKPGVTGLPCNQCEPHRYNLTTGSFQGCRTCDCDSLGTFPGTTCDPVSGQCWCLPNRRGRTCNHCQPGRNLKKTSGSKANIKKDVACEVELMEGEQEYVEFKKKLRCQPCNCRLSGALNETCHLVTGQCFCKPFVMGSKCEACVPGASHLDVHNPWGCSKIPSQQPPPRGEVHSSSAISLTWSPPDSPNGPWLTYRLLRGGSEIYTSEDQYPYNIQYFLDTALSPYTSYSYHIEATNVHGSTRSAAVIYTTKPGLPQGHLNLSYVVPVGSNSVTLTWGALSNHSGPIERYTVSCVPSDNLTSCAPYEGLKTSATIWNLTPFTKYQFSVQACTSRGCVQGSPIMVTTAQAPPQKLSPPKIWKVGATELRAEWAPPAEANGIVIKYELYMKRPRSTEELRVFQSSGWLSPQSPAEPAHEDTQRPPQTAAAIIGLEPYTEYAFRVAAQNMVGRVFSTWISERTGEAAPVFMPPPSVFPLSSNSLNVSWEKPPENVTRGGIVGYLISMVSEQSPQQSGPVVFQQLLHTAQSQELSYTVRGLKPYRIYIFTISLCNSVGCVTSASGAGQTLAAVATMMGKERFTGSGYYKFPSTTHRLGTDFTGIKASFRTRVSEGLIFFAASPGNQEEYFALQLKKGRPYFLFDSQGSPVEVTTTNDHGKQYSDDQWHEMIAVRHQAFGQITLDGRYTGSAATLNGSAVIGDNAGLYVGGLPLGYTVLRRDPEITQKGFVGCLKDVHFMKNYNPSAVWEPLDWQSSEEQINVYNSWEGCPSSLSEGAQFLGTGFLELHSDVFHGGMDFEISLKFRTDQVNGLLLFIYNKDGPDFLAVELRSGVLSFRLNASLTFTQVDLWLGLSYCNGKWNKVVMKKEGTLLTAGLNALMERYSVPEARPLVVNSPVHIGGIPQELWDAYGHLSLEQGFSGCVKDVTFSRGAVVNLASVSSSAVRVNLDGCLSPASAANCRGNDSIPVFRGRQRSARDSGLQPFTEYLYRVRASHEGGAVYSEWSRGHTTAAAPPSVPAPSRVRSIDGYSVEVTWDEPVGVRGVIEKYVLRAYSGNGPPVPRTPSASAEFVDTTTFTGVLTGLLPFRNYTVTLTACTLAGCTESSQAVNISTPQEAPQEVQSPVAKSFPNSLLLSWSPPSQANGVVTQYSLYMDGRLIYSGHGENYTVTDLGAFTSHRFLLSACTLGGCANSSWVTLHTAQLPPEHVAPPVLTVLDSRTVHVQWKQPRKLNGILEHYILYVSNHTHDFTVWTVVYNSSEPLQDLMLQDLTPGNKYRIKLGACTGGGCMVSEASQALTHEDIPEGVAAPEAPSYSPGSFNISWMQPEYPNAPDGVLPPRLSSATPTSLQVVWSTPARNNAPGSPRYQLQMRPAHTSHGFRELFSNPSALLSYEVTDLQPCSEYEFRLVASNAFGSAHSSWIPLLTAEDGPGAMEPPILRDVRSTTVSVTWHPPLKPNRVITHYNIYQNGDLYLRTSGNVTNCTATHLQPHTAYKFQVEACTSQGCSLSPESQATWTLPGPPGGILSPELFSDTPTSVIISWQPPTHPNDLVENVTIERREKGKEETSTLVTLPGNHFTRFIDKTPALSPWTQYEYRVLVGTLNGGTNSSAWGEVTTRPSRPLEVQPPEVKVLGPDSAKVTWKAPFMPNGNILSYEIHMPDPHVTITNVTPSVLSQIITQLSPFTNYSVTVIACSGGNGHLGGCTESSPTLVTTRPAAPQGVSPLSVTPLSESYVGVSWQPPSNPNGPDLRYELLRCKIQQPLASNPPEDLNLWHNIYSGTQWFYEDKGLSRFTTYEYKLFVHNSIGFTPSLEATVITLAGFPEKGANISVSVLNHTAIDVKWAKPTFQDLQGDVEYYTLFWSSATSNESLRILPGASSYIIGHLNPNTEYWIFISVFNGVHSINSTVLQATTCDGEPQGMQPPEVVIISRTAARVIWSTPSDPNGAVTEYSVYVNNKLYKTGMDVPGSLILRNLSPFTVYDIQVEVCTQYACTKSNGTQITTVEDTPSNIAIPSIHDITSRSLRIDWVSPGKPKGIILGYNLLRKTWHPCSKTQKLMEEHSNDFCKVVKCPKPKNICGHICFSPEAKVCCNGVLYEPQPGYHCCEEKYIPFLPNSTAVCCGGRIQEAQPNHECCYGYYAKILPGEICCLDEQHGRVSVDLGDACCGRMPYSSAGHQMCCGGTLHDGRGRQCCGGQVVSSDLQCCGGAARGLAYAHLPGMFCCGQDYVNMSDTICCSASSGESKAHVKKKVPLPVKCCETELIPESQKCCNGVGYNPLKYVCSDKISTGMMMKETAVCGTLCPASKEATAYCGHCDFNFTSHVCVVTSRSLNSTGKASTEEICPSPEEIVHTGDMNTFSFTDVNLEPYTMYEYRISARNSYGPGLSHPVRASTKEDVPESVRPPRWTTVGDPEDTVVLHWRKPIQPNGPITYYILLRNGIERFRGTSLSFWDTEGIHPSQEYSYQLQACTVAGCTASREECSVFPEWKEPNETPKSAAPGDRRRFVQRMPRASLSTRSQTAADSKAAGRMILESFYAFYSDPAQIYQVVVATTQGVPESVEPPSVTALSAEALHLSWSVPGKPNGVIKEYRLWQEGRGVIYMDTTHRRQHTVTGVWVTARHTIISSTSLELYWSPPEKPNGLISQYQLSRNGTVLFLGGSEEQNFTDKHLEPNTRYIYKLEAKTGGGSRTSDGYIVQTPLWTPEEIHPPYNVTVVGPYSIFVAWTPPGILIPQIPVEYNVLLNDGSVTPLTFSVAHQQSTLLENLAPFSQYKIRIQACQNGSCGVSSKVSVKTSEAAPEDLSPPLLKVLGSRCIKVQWMPPQKPNGIITNYFIHRRPAGMENVSLEFVWSEGTLEFTDEAGTLRPFTHYEYRARAQNSRGCVDSAWSSARTLEAPPQALAAPWARATGAHSILLTWMEPESPNGLISQYSVVYRESTEDLAPGSAPVRAFTVTGTSHQAHLFGLEPFTTYHIGVVAANLAGEVSSPWTLVQTLESSPMRLSNFTVDQKENSRALLLRWAEPMRINGVIKASLLWLAAATSISHLLWPRAAGTSAPQHCTFCSLQLLSPPPSSRRRDPHLVPHRTEKL
ncbi:Usherin [Heterocephalus glaber]|uniref:Usherin n=1 Tax=Heterocephalus glaber TaxID=10181 RepID=G5ATT5_HETGA|nr:Usherin [Heterocephalus glaber]